MPILNTRAPVEALENRLIPFGPTHPIWLTIPAHAHHLLRNLQLRINGRRKGMDKFGPGFIPEPKHRAAVAAEGSVRSTLGFLRRAAGFDSVVFPREKLGIDIG